MLNEKLTILNTKPMKIIFNQYLIKLNYHMDIIWIQIQNNYLFYESSFNLEYFNLTFRLNLSINKMIQFIYDIIHE